MQKLNPFLLNFILKNDMKKKLPLVTCADGNFHPSGDCYAEPWQSLSTA